MSCTSVKINRVGEIGAETGLASEGIRSVLSREGAPGVRCSKQDTGITASMDREAIRARTSMVCTPSIRVPYLEIEPEVVWVYDGLESMNDVFSNTSWNIT